MGLNKPAETPIILLVIALMCKSKRLTIYGYQSNGDITRKKNRHAADSSPTEGERRRMTAMKVSMWTR
jgi:hypothetical protein